MRIEGEKRKPSDTFGIGIQIRVSSPLEIIKTREINYNIMKQGVIYILFLFHIHGEI